MTSRILGCFLVLITLIGCANTMEVEATANKAAADASAAAAAAESSRAAADRASQAAASAQSTADQAISAAIEAQAAAEANRELFERSSGQGSSSEVFLPQSKCAPKDKPYYCVWFATNRKPESHSSGVTFSGERDSKLHYGNALVLVPKSHRFGETGSSALKRLLTGKDDRLFIEKINKLDRSAFEKSLAQELKLFDKGERSAFVYIHGYNTDFSEAIIRAAQMGVDLKIRGITAAFSWPSAGSRFAYTFDEATVEASESYLEQFLRQIVDHPEVDTVNILAHSMGNRPLLRVVERIAASPSADQKPINQIILAAPDVDVAVFRQLAKHYPTISTRTTLYVSAEDRLLGLSGIIHSFQRAGIGPPVTVVDGIDTVAVEEVDMSLLGHSYIAEAHAVLNDMFEILTENTSPEKRIRLASANNLEEKRFWFFRR